MKYSIRTKLIILILGALILLALILGGISIYFTGKLTDEYAHQYVSLMCQTNAAKIDAIFAPLEKSVDYMSINALEEVANPSNLKDEIYYQNYIDKMGSILWNTANNTDGAIAVYLRFNPDICEPTSGILMTRNKLGAEMQNITPTDLSAYDEDDIEHVGWYYQPIRAEKPIWMLPYYNKNIGVYMISYVVPLFKQDTTVGVLGMDINFNHITEQVQGIKVYKSGYAYITDSEGKVIYHPHLQYGDTVTSQKGWWNSECVLNNGMVLNITAPVAEIEESRNDLMRNMAFGAVMIMIVFILTTIFVTNSMISPLQKLNQIAIEVSEGNYDVDFNFKRPNDEIGQLTSSFEHTIVKLNEYMTYVNGLAYKDSLTGVRNRTAYDYEVSLLETELESQVDLTFGLAVFDINNLKRINDELGHEKGDILIKGACEIICKVFSHSPVFRIGGDEFVAIIRDTSNEQIEELFRRLRMEMEATWSKEEPELRIAVAYGYSRYDSTADNKQIESVFKRADDIMYANKKAMKEGKGNETNRV